MKKVHNNIPERTEDYHCVAINTIVNIGEE